MYQEEKVRHPIPPVYDENARILILGSFPSVKSREAGFFYGHPRNRFWAVLSAVMDEPLPQSIEEKKTFLLSNHIAVWDVIGECRIRGSSDASIEDVRINDLSVILEKAEIKQIFVNGKTAEKMYERYAQDLYQRKAIVLPSTSPANAAWNLERLIGQWECIRDYL
ncbi:MAG: DNA-deoxyinosine glycosylase [Erysipelotrichaceae bacterium]|nr:DNA-deoxyinosine glycosylase [Erysipelotrichaceae bacterium]